MPFHLVAVVPPAADGELLGGGCQRDGRAAAGRGLGRHIGPVKGQLAHGAVHAHAAAVHGGGALDKVDAGIADKVGGVEVAGVVVQLQGAGPPGTSSPLRNSAMRVDMVRASTWSWVT